MIPIIGNASVFETTDRIPAARACSSNCEVACCVNIMIGTGPSARLFSLTSIQINRRVIVQSRHVARPALDGRLFDAS
jgi:hypothetical protein